jgi:hypothetical protein
MAQGLSLIGVSQRAASSLSTADDTDYIGRAARTNGMHPTRDTNLVIHFQRGRRRVMPGVMSPLHIESQMIPAAPQLNESELAWIIERLVE